MAGSTAGSATVTIRAARAQDADAVLELWSHARSLAASTPDRADLVGALIDDGALLVADDAGRVVGTLVAAWDGWRGNMYRLAVLPEYRRRGIARRLVEAGHARLRDKGARRVTALVASAEQDVTALWRSVGYEHDEALVRFVANL